MSKTRDLGPLGQCRAHNADSSTRGVWQGSSFCQRFGRPYIKAVAMGEGVDIAYAAEHYAEDGGVPEGVYPVFVSVLKARWPAPEARQGEVDRLTAAVAEASHRPAENVHLFYQPEGAGRVAFGGRLVPEA